MWQEIPNRMISGTTMITSTVQGVPDCQAACQANPICGAIDHFSMNGMNVCRLWDKDYPIVDIYDKTGVVYKKFGVAPTNPGTVPQPAVPTESSVLDSAISPSIYFFTDTPNSGFEWNSQSGSYTEWQKTNGFWAKVLGSTKPMDITVVQNLGRETIINVNGAHRTVSKVWTSVTQPAVPTESSVLESAMSPLIYKIKDSDIGFEWNPSNNMYQPWKKINGYWVLQRYTS